MCTDFEEEIDFEEEMKIELKKLSQNLFLSPLQVESIHIADSSISIRINHLYNQFNHFYKQLKTTESFYKFMNEYIKEVLKECDEKKVNSYLQKRDEIFKKYIGKLLSRLKEYVKEK